MRTGLLHIFSLSGIYFIEIYSHGGKNMSDNNKRFSYTSRLFDRAQTCELSDDFTLPDYMPAVGRVLSCTATAAQPTLYLSAGGVECSGGVRYSLLYESADDGSLFCAELPAEYDVMLTPERDVRASSLGSDVSGICDAVLENTTARVTAPRRLTVKSRLRLRPSLPSLTHIALCLSSTLHPYQWRILLQDCLYPTYKIP